MLLCTPPNMCHENEPAWEFSTAQVKNKAAGLAVWNVSPCRHCCAMLFVGLWGTCWSPAAISEIPGSMSFLSSDRHTAHVS